MSGGRGDTPEGSEEGGVPRRKKEGRQRPGMAGHHSGQRCISTQLGWRTLEEAGRGGSAPEGHETHLFSLVCKFPSIPFTGSVWA